MKTPPPKRPVDADNDTLLRDKMAEIEALIEAIANEEPDCDLRLAKLLENETEDARLLIIEKLRAMIKARTDEQEKQLTQVTVVAHQEKIKRQRGIFLQWLAWMISEEGVERLRDAFLAIPMMEKMVRNVGHVMAGKGMNEIQPGDKRELGGISANAPNLKPAQQRERDERWRG